MARLIGGVVFFCLSWLFQICVGQELSVEADKLLAAEKQALQGTWQGVSGAEGGKAVPETECEIMQMTFEGDVLILRVSSEPKELEEIADYRIDVSQSPKHLDLLPRKKGLPKIEAIYEVKGDEFKICARSQPGTGDRPKDLSTDKEGYTWYLLKRKKQ